MKQSMTRGQERPFMGNLKPILNISNIKACFPLTLLISLLISLCYTPKVTSQELRGKAEAIEIATDKEANIGDTLSLRIKKSDKGHPKVYFNKTKIPVFLLNDSYYRGLAPLSADLKPGKYQVEVFYKNKVTRTDVNIKETKYPIESLTLPATVAGLKASRVEKAAVWRALSIVSDKKLWSGKFLLPNSARQSTIYGVKRKINGVISPSYFHKGLDFAGKEGSIIKAPENGKVILAGLEPKGFVVNGNCIFLDHGHGVISAYLHLSSLLVKEVDFVNKGHVIGKVGSTGIASGPHLHWGMYVLGKTVDPIGWTSMI